LPTRLVPTVPLNGDDAQRVSTIKRAEGDDPTWDEALETGKKILKSHRERLDSGGPGYTMLPGGSEEAKRVLQNNYMPEDSRADFELNDFLTRSLARDGITTDENRWIYSHIHENTCLSEFKNEYIYDNNRQKGVIIADENTREKGAILTWSEVAFQEYNLKARGRVLENLKYIYQSTITNTSTREFISRAIDSDEGDIVHIGGDEWHVFKPGSDTFTVLLGSENGRGAGYMVNDHLSELGRKQVSEIHVHERPYLMKIVIGPIP
jgi:hypothetical protein